MRKISARRITYPKELFLAMCLISGEVSSQTVRAMKKDFGEHTVTRVIIHDLVQQGVIEKIGYRSNYGYTLTEYGCEYLETKVPDRYNYEFFSPLCITTTYKQKMRERNQAMSMVLYQLARQGISITDHYALAADLFNGRVAEINESFFITIKELRTISQRLAAKFPTMSYGCIITKENIIAVYYPDKGHHLWANNEAGWHSMLTDITKFPNAHFKDTRIIEALYLYDTMANLKDSYIAGVNRIGTHSASTKQCYNELKYFKSHTMLFNSPTAQLSDILNNRVREKINQYLMRTYGIKPCAPNIDAPFADGVYNGDTYAALMWDLNPQKMVQIMKYVIEDGGKPLILYFSEQEEIIYEILSVNKRLKNKILFADISRDEIIQSLGGEVTYDNITEQASGESGS